MNYWWADGKHSLVLGGLRTNLQPNNMSCSYCRRRQIKFKLSVADLILIVKWNSTKSFCTQSDNEDLINVRFCNSFSI